MSLMAHPRRTLLLAAFMAGAVAHSQAEESAVTLPEPALLDHVDDSVTAGVAALVTIPEPGILVSLGGGVGVLLGLQRFRRRA